jgi:hypothetical protein
VFVIIRRGMVEGAAVPLSFSCVARSVPDLISSPRKAGLYLEFRL